jgi:hypothetical protein
MLIARTPETCLLVFVMIVLHTTVNVQLKTHLSAHQLIVFGEIGETGLPAQQLVAVELQPNHEALTSLLNMEEPLALDLPLTRPPATRNVASQIVLSIPGPRGQIPVQIAPTPLKPKPVPEPLTWKAVVE